MPTDAELRTLFRDSAGPEASIDAATVIRRSRRRRLPQLLGVGSVLTLAVAGIGFASFNGLQGLTPSMTAADAPVSVAESGPFSGTDMTARNTCSTGVASDGNIDTGLEVVSDFPAVVSAGQAVEGTLTLTNTGMQPVAGVTSGPAVTLSRDGVEVHQTDVSAMGADVSLAPGESMRFTFTLDAIGCDASGDTGGAPLEPDEYELSAMLTVESPDGTLRHVGGPASAITLR